MGYKLAGYDVLGCCEIDDKMSACYEKNLKPKIIYKEDIRNLVGNRGLPRELFRLDVLDGSPPCTLFSSARMNREKQWGKEKKFREGQKKQVLDTLFFDFIELAGWLRPRVVVAENVMGMLRGAAKDYVRRIIGAFGRAGYAVRVQDINTSRMGLPQERLRLAFLGVRLDLAERAGIRTAGIVDKVPEIDMRFSEPLIPFRDVAASAKRGGLAEFHKDGKMCKFLTDNWHLVKPGSTFATVHPRGSFFNNAKLREDAPARTLTTFSWNHIHPTENRTLNVTEFRMCSSFPLDYDFVSESPYYVMGMSVPPVMMAQIAWRVRKQWLDRMAGARG